LRRDLERWDRAAVVPDPPDASSRVLIVHRYTGVIEAGVNKTAGTLRVDTPICTAREKRIVEMVLERTKKSNKVPVGLFFALPYILFLCAFMLLPILYTFYTSLFSDAMGNQFIGLQNYLEVFKDRDFQKALKIIVGYVVIGVPLFLFLAVGLALLLDSPLGRFKNLSKFFFFLPFAMPPAVSTFMWAFVYTPEVSPYQGLFGLFPFIKDYQFFLSRNELLSTPFLTIENLTFAMVNIVCWQNAGGWILVLSAVLQNASQDVIDAARIDGANEWNIIRHVKIPLLSDTLVVMGVSTFAYISQLIAEPIMLTSSLQLSKYYTPNYWASTQAFSNGNFNLSAAASNIMILVVLLASVGALVFTRSIQSQRE
jgi:multiple sugar transport system permease protein